MAVEDTTSFKSHDNHHHHHHSKRRILKTKTCRLLSMLSLTFSYFIVELVVGNITNSVALVADAFHMLSDVIALVIAIVAVRIAKRRSNKNTYGWVRAEVVGANINTVFLLALCLTIIFDAIKRFIEPEPIENVNLLLIVGSIGLGINIIGLFLFQGFHGHTHGGKVHGHSHDDDSHDHEEKISNQSIEIEPENPVLNTNNFERHSTRALQEAIAECANTTNGSVETIVELSENGDNGENDNKKEKSSKKKGSMNMHGVFLHVLADALGSVVVIISALLIKFVPHDIGDRKHWTIYIDPALSVFIVIIITISTIPLFKESTFILLQTIPKHLEVNRIKSQLLKKIPEIIGIHELHVWRLTNEKIIASAHLSRTNLSNYMSIADKVKKFFHSIGIHSVTIQYECDEDIQPLPIETSHSIRKSSTEEKIAGDCLLRCENVECDTQSCCTKNSDRTNTLLNNNHTIPVFTISQPQLNINDFHIQLPATPTIQDEHL